jgi:hypothetical protein
MALHPRLGASSPARHCAPELLHTIMKLALAAEQTRLAMIRVRAGDHVDRIELHFSDESISAYGGCGGTWHEPVMLAPGEGIAEVRCRQRGSLDSIQFVTTRGRESPIFGRQDPTGARHASIGVRARFNLEVANLSLSRTPQNRLSPLASGYNFDVVYATRLSAHEEHMLETVCRDTFAKIHARPATEPIHNSGAVYPDFDESDEPDESDAW